MQFNPHGCPRCNGSTVDLSDWWGTYQDCIDCGWHGRYGNNKRVITHALDYCGANPRYRFTKALFTESQKRSWSRGLEVWSLRTNYIFSCPIYISDNTPCSNQMQAVLAHNSRQAARVSFTEDKQMTYNPYACLGVDRHKIYVMKGGNGWQ